ncbi:MAG: ABC transporter ATP-binding protein [Acidimicrobiia bacterium]
MTDAALHVSDATVEARSVSKWFGQKVAVSEVTCSFGPGVTGLLGPNGAGKTTLLRVLTGLAVPSQGEVRVLGQDPRADVSVYRSTALVLEDEAVYKDLTLWEFVALNARLSGVDRPADVAREAILTVELKADSDRRLREFSRGMRQRAKVAAALVHQPSVLFLDEPLNGTDPRQRARLIDLFSRLGAEGRTVIVSSHVLAEVERMADRVIAMVDGHLVAAGDVGAIRSAMSDKPRLVRVDAHPPRELGSALLREPSVVGLTVTDGTLHIQSTDVRSLAVALPRIAREHDAVLTRVEPQDESLESVFRYLVEPK